MKNLMSESRQEDGTKPEETLMRSTRMQNYKILNCFALVSVALFVTKVTTALGQVPQNSVQVDNTVHFYADSNNSDNYSCCGAASVAIWELNGFTYSSSGGNNNNFFVGQNLWSFRSGVMQFSGTAAGFMGVNNGHTSFIFDDVLLSTTSGDPGSFNLMNTNLGTINASVRNGSVLDGFLGGIPANSFPSNISLENGVFGSPTQGTSANTLISGGYGVVIHDGTLTGQLDSIVPTGTVDLSRGFNVRNGVATVVSSGIADLGPDVRIGGGTITAVNGITLGPGSKITGSGTVNSPISAGFGSVIRAEVGNLQLGDADSYVGFTSDGELYTSGDTVTLHDKNQAVLPSLTQIGDENTEGQLTAPNGMLLEEGKTLFGRGTVSGDFKNQGEVIGDADVVGERIVFASGYEVSGIGTFENTEFLGDFNPGNSPGLLEVTDVALGLGSSLNIELGGLTAGTEYDQLFSQGMLILEGSLGVSLINSFTLSSGQSFTIVDNNGAVNGQFAGLSQGDLVSNFGEIGLFIDYAGGDGNDIVLFASSANLNAGVPEPSSLILLGLGALGLARHTRRRRRRA